MDIYQIAEKANVSIATVSRVINNTGSVSEKTRQKILKIIDEENYIPNPYAKKLADNSSMKLVGIICSNVTDLYYANAVSALEFKLSNLGYDSILFCTRNDDKRNDTAIQLLLSKNVDAIIFVGSIFNITEGSLLHKASKRLPIFFINGYVDYPNTYSVYIDDKMAMEDNIRLLHTKGRKNILYLYDAESYSGKKKIEGYLSAHRKLNIPCKEHYILKCNKDIADIEKTLTGFIADNVIDALVASEDLLALVGMNVLIKHGYQVPQDVSVIGYNNSIISQCSLPKLTTLDNKVNELCRHAVSKLQTLFAGKSTPNHEIVDYELIIRDSV